MMWNASVNAICDRAHGTGLTAKIGSKEPAQATLIYFRSPMTPTRNPSQGYTCSNCGSPGK